jgi:hypothetical protein
MIACYLALVTVPDNFYDEEVEAEKEFADIKASLNLGGLQKLTITKVRYCTSAATRSCHF